ncbi:MAG: DUF885 family protein [Alphaproteobacteria bacterium]|nr:DUF885 family protein [Alphaproteobacteria bacterium]
MWTRRAFLASTSALVLNACATRHDGEGASPGPNPSLAAFFERAFEAELDASPQFATAIGDKRNYGRWDDPSLDADEARDRRLAAAVAAMRARFDPAQLNDPQDQLSCVLFEKRLERARAQRPFRLHSYAFNQMFGVQSSIPSFLINQHRVTSIADAEAYIDRLEGVRAYLGGMLARSAEAQARGVLPPRFVYAYVLSDCANVIAGAPFADGPDSPLRADFAGKVSALGLADADIRRLIAAADDALRSSVAPAYQEAIATLTAQQSAAGDDDGVWRLPDGDAYYAERLLTQTTTNLSADEIHEIGLDNVARLHTDMEAIMRQVGFSGSLRDFFHFMETDARFYLPQTEEGRAAYIARADAAIDAMRARIPAFFNRTPQAGMVVRAVEPFRERSAGLAFYQRPSADGSRPGVYYANTVDMRALPLYQLEALAFHEGIPGHHFQIALQQELDGLPRFRRFGGGFTAYSEGWALYCELLAKEMGFYADPYSDFGRLTLELRRAIRLVVDTGLHAKRWPREQAIQYVLDNQPGEEAQARRDIDRYIVMPGQATAYLIGSLEIQRLRRTAQERLGPAFSIGAFHDVVLSSGAVPLEVLETMVNRWSET